MVPGSKFRVQSYKRRGQGSGFLVQVVYQSYLVVLVLSKTNRDPDPRPLTP